MSKYALPGLFPPLSYDSSKVTLSSLDIVSIDFSFTKTEEKVSDSPSSSTSYSVPIEVHVTAAKVDAYELVKLLTCKKQKVGKPLRGNIRRRATSVGRVVAERYQRSSSGKEDGGGLENAMQFELSVDVDGDTYNTCRSLAEIRHLRQELILESCSSTYDSVTATRADAPSSSQQQHHIPELPEMIEGSSVTNFSLLNVTLIEHAPVLESWFLQVIKLVGSLENSPCLRYFLCDSLLMHTPTIPLQQSLQRGDSAPARLESIMEEAKFECDRDDLDV
jgi:hypothetical protein